MTLSADSTRPPAGFPTGGATISGSGLSVPQQLLTNADLEKMVDTSDEWITQRTGIRQRHISAPGQTSALSQARLQPKQLDMVICASMTPDLLCPQLASQTVAAIGAVPCGAMDVNIACSGFVGALNIAANFIRSGFYRNVAVVGAEQLSRIVNWSDRGTCILFGDGAGAAIVSATDNPAQGCIYQAMHSDGSMAKVLYIPRSEADIPPGAEFSGKLDTLQMNGREVYKFAVTTLLRSLHEAMDACKLTPADVKLVIPHQSNARILESAREKLGFGDDKLYINIDRYGNTSAASVGICLAELMAAGRVGPGDTVIFVGLGGGLTWAVSVWRL
jgi:3-oxoacyl-[acyl-carrier-protein] synthase-3